MKITDRIKKIMEIACHKLLHDNNIFDEENIEYMEYVLEVPPERSLGDYSTNFAMRYCKLFKKAPLDVGELLKKTILEDNEAKEVIQDIQVVKPGFINFYLCKKIVLEYLIDIIEKKESYGKSNIGNEKKVNIEFVSANPTGPLHVGHGRGAALGDILCNLYSYVGYEVIREYYVNDCGRQMNILGKTVKAWIDALAENKEPIFKDEDGQEWYRGLYMKDVSLEVVEKYGKDFNEQELGFYAGQIILQGIKDDLKYFGVKDFDVWKSEKSLHEQGKIKDVLEKLEQKGYIEEREGAKWFKSSLFNDDSDRVVVRSTGELTYLAADIAYHIEKVTSGVDKVIDIWGADHHGYIPRVRASINAFDYDDSILNVILCQFVRLVRAGEPVSMSTRSGEFVTLREVIDEVGRDAARFFFVMRKSDAHLDFDLEIAKKHSMDNPVYYIQYAHARIFSIFKQKSDNLKDIENEIKENLNFKILEKLEYEEEFSMVKIMINFQDTIEGSVLNNETHRLVRYLQELASAFHSFYNKHRVITEDKEVSLARVILINAVRNVLKNGLLLLGIEALEEM